jgi:signal transduction histidine kinase
LKSYGHFPDAASGSLCATTHNFDISSLPRSAQPQVRVSDGHVAGCIVKPTWSIRNRFLLFSILCLIPIAILIFYLMDEIDNRSNEEIVTSEATLSSLVTGSLTNYLTSNFRTIENISNMSTVIEQDDPDALNAILGQARTIRPDQAGVFIVNAENVVVGQSGTDVALLTPNIQSQISTTLTTGQRTISQRIDLDLEQPTSVIVLLVPITTLTETASTEPIATSTPLANQADDASKPSPTQAPTPAGTPGTRPPGTTIGVVGAVINVDSLNQLVIPSIRPRTEILIVNDEQIITATGDIMEQEQRFFENLNAAISEFPDATTDVFTMEGLNGNDRIATYAPVQLDNAGLAVVITNPAPTSELETAWVRILMILGFTGIAVIALAYAFGELTSRSLDELVLNARDLADGDFSKTIVPRGSGEIREMGEALASLRVRLEENVTGVEEHQSERVRQTDQMRDLLRRDLRMQEDERRHIASEIHDAVSPLITGALYQARALLMSNGEATRESVAETLDGVNKLLERASEELHEIIFDLRPPDLDDIGVVAAIEAFVSTIQRTGLEARLEVVHDPPPLTPEVRLGIYRIVQEALHNVLRHAGADEAVVKMEYQENVLRVTIRDNGTGFDPDKARRPTSLGLLSMRERAAAIDASFEIISRPGGGTAIIIEREDTGSIMSDELLDDLLRHRADTQRLANEEHSADNGTSDDVPAASDSDVGRR